ncbi:MAG: DUF1538 domain-containing protein [Methylovulum sp.]|nr:DUF1538 domain-containing protein [Methylovulum sp.]
MLKNRFIKQLFNSFLDLLPILAVVVIFQVLIIRQPIPDVLQLTLGMLFVVIGLTLFVLGLEQSLFPLGESMAHAFARKGSVFWLLSFAFCLGFGAAIAEPALIAMSTEAAKIASQGDNLADTDTARAGYAMGLRLIVALAIGFAIVLGVFRIICGWPLYYLIIGSYAAIALITPFAPADIIGIAYDVGGIATSTITVPLVTALGVGLAASIKGRNPIADGFGLVAFAALVPTIFVMLYGIVR